MRAPRRGAIKIPKQKGGDRKVRKVIMAILLASIILSVLAGSATANNGVALDIKPGSCPNPLNTMSKGVLPVAILGTGDLDVTEIDPSSVRLEGVESLRSNIEDVATPFVDGDECGCTEEGPDGFDDLTLKFKTQEVVATLGNPAPEDEITLVITGNLLDGTPFTGYDCVKIVGPEMPEFTTIAVPVAITLGMLLFFSYRKRRKEE
jgi:hypothetical protein